MSFTMDSICWQWFRHKEVPMKRRNAYLAHFSFLKKIYFFNTCIMCRRISASIAWNWSYRQFWATWCGAGKWTWALWRKSPPAHLHFLQAGVSVLLLLLQSSSLPAIRTQPVWLSKNPPGLPKHLATGEFSASPACRHSLNYSALLCKPI